VAQIFKLLDINLSCSLFIQKVKLGNWSAAILWKRFGLKTTQTVLLLLHITSMLPAKICSLSSNVAVPSEMELAIIIIINRHFKMLN